MISVTDPGSCEGLDSKKFLASDSRDWILDHADAGDGLIFCHGPMAFASRCWDVKGWMPKISPHVVSQHRSGKTGASHMEDHEISMERGYRVPACTSHQVTTRDAPQLIDQTESKVLRC